MAKRILIVDDAMFMRKMLRTHLEKMGYTVAGEGASGLELLTIYPKLMPDLVTLDIMMPKMDGLEALKKLKMTFPDALVVMVSAMGQREMVINAIQSGAKDFIVKPFDIVKVQETIKRVLALTQKS